MSYNTKNYTEQGGNTTHFGGKVIFEEGVEIEGLPEMPVAAAVAASEATDVAGVNTVLNAVIASLKTAGLMKSE